MVNKKEYTDKRNAHLKSVGLCRNCAKSPIEYTRSGVYCSECLDYFKQKDKEYKSRLPEGTTKARSRSYYERNKEKILQSSAEYTKLHPEIKKKSQTAYRQRNKEMENKRTLEYKRLHQSHYNELGKKWRKENPDRAKIDAERRRAALLGVGGSISETEWKELCSTYGNKCLWCDREDVPLTIDHIVPISKGGVNSIHNAQPLCKSCNSKKRVRVLDFRPFGRAILDWT